MKILTITTLVAVGLAASLQARILEVGQGKEFATPGTAVAQALAGDTVRIHKGNYEVRGLEVKVPVTLLGVGWPVLDGTGGGGVIHVMSDRVRIEGLVIRNTGHSSMQDYAGIRLSSVRDVVICNNRLEETFFGIYLENSRHCTIEENYLRSGASEEQALGNGIHCWKCDSLSIHCNTTSQHRDGIYFEFVTHSDIAYNYSFKNLRYGLHFMFSHNDAYTGNWFEENGAGVAVMYTHDVHMEDNTFIHNWGAAAYGLLLKEISKSTITRNHFTNNTTGIYMEGTSAIHASDNRFDRNGYAMRVQANCYDGTFTRGNYVLNSFDVATNGTRIMNSFDGNYWDKYEGYDLGGDGAGDVAYRPVALYSLVVERMPPAMMLYRSFITSILDRAEKVMPAITPVDLSDRSPRMKPW